jgi:peptidyl-tRNA hydrolase
MKYQNISVNKSKMYILIRDDVDLGHAILAAAHASLSGYLTFISNEIHAFDDKEDDEKPVFVECPTQDWSMNSFRKVVCKVSATEFEKAKTYGTNMKDYRIMVESGLGGMEVAIVFKPRDNFEPFFKSLKLYK